jgi:PAS domain S-box-containing protein
MTDSESFKVRGKPDRARARVRSTAPKKTESHKTNGGAQITTAVGEAQVSAAGAEAPISTAGANNFLGLITPNGVVIAANHPAPLMAGRERIELVGIPVWEARCLQGAPAVAEAVRDAVERAVAGDSVRFDADVGVDGEITNLEFSFAPVGNARGVVNFIIAQLHEFTDRVPSAAGVNTAQQSMGIMREAKSERGTLVRATTPSEQRLAELAGGKLAAIVHTSNDAIVSKDLNGIINSWNEAAERIFGYSAAEAIGQPIMMLLPAEQQGEELQIMEKIRRGERVEAYDTRRRRKDGSLVEISVSVSPILDSRGRIIGASKIARDISDRKATEAALLESEARVRLATDATGVGIWEWHLATNRIHWDPYMFQIFGIVPTPDGLVNYDTWRSVVEPEDLPGFEAALRQIAEHPEKRKREFRIRRCSDGQLRYIHAVDTVHTDAQGRPEWAIGSIWDVTEHTQMRDALMTADRRKDEFLATLAHELRNPLAPIRMGLEVLKRVEHSSPSGEQTRAMMDRQLNQLIRLVDDLMDVSRISSGRIELQKTPVPLGTVLESALETSRPIMVRMGHDLTYVPPAGALTVNADVTRLAQVFVNLLNNAAKYTPHGGRIRLSVERQGGEVLVVIRDTGIGISAEALPHIFDMFTQVKGSSELAQGGLGIGLSLVKRLVELHGGNVEASSDGVDAGAEFVVRLPLCEARHEKPVT